MLLNINIVEHNNYDFGLDFYLSHLIYLGLLELNILIYSSINGTLFFN